MKIVNKTGWSTKDLRKLLLAGFKYEGVNPSNYVVIITATSAGWIGGKGWYYEPKLSLHLTADANNRLEEVAQVLVHEICHTLNLRHNEMIRSKEIEVPWIKGLTLNRKSKPKKKKLNLREARHAHAKKMLETHLSKLRREEKLLEKWRKKVRYYECVVEKRGKERIAARKSGSTRSEEGGSYGS